jgi:DNA polymerase-3 subunit delta'
VLDALFKLCHDALAVASGAAPRYFPPDKALSQGHAERLADWSRELTRIARHAEHPWNEGLLVEALVRAGHEALQPAGTAARSGARA